jgi:hypothetical protein
MRRMFLAAATITAMSGWTSVNTPEAKTAAPTHAAHAAQAPRASVSQENPTGIPSYLMRQDGLMINGLLPANGWQG